MINRYGVLFLVLAGMPNLVSAQNVTGYDLMADPFLFLLREPSVHRDLDLSEDQKKRLVQLNESVDGILLANRNNRNAEEVQQQTQEVMQKSRRAAAEIFSKQQLLRMRQIAYRLRGMSFVLIPEAAKELSLSAKQKQTIETAVKEAAETISKVQSSEYQGDKAHREAQRTAAAARKREQDEILAALSNTQKQKLVSLVGKNFDPSSLGQVAFKAPDLVNSGQWINTDGLGLSDLRGKVVALHFFAFR